MLYTPSILNQLATPFHRQPDVSPDSASLVSPSPAPALPTPTVDILSRCIRTAGGHHTDGIVCWSWCFGRFRTSHIDAAGSDVDTAINCSKYWCSYGGGESGQDKSHDGLFTCTRWKYNSVCIICMNDGRFARHKHYPVPDISWQGYLNATDNQSGYKICCFFFTFQYIAWHSGLWRYILVTMNCVMAVSHYAYEINVWIAYANI